MAMEHPHLYTPMTSHPLPREALPDGVEAAWATGLTRLSRLGQSRSSDSRR